KFIYYVGYQYTFSESFKIIKKLMDFLIRILSKYNIKIGHFITDGGESYTKYKIQEVLKNLILIYFDSKHLVKNDWCQLIDGNRALYYPLEETLIFNMEIIYNCENAWILQNCMINSI